MANFFVGLWRASFNNYGDIEGPMTKLKRGRMTLGILNGHVTAWIVGRDDIEFKKEDVASVTLTDANLMVKDLGSNGGKPVVINVYRIELKNGEVGILRLKRSSAQRILNLLQ